MNRSPFKTAQFGTLDPSFTIDGYESVAIFRGHVIRRAYERSIQCALGLMRPPMLRPSLVASPRKWNTRLTFPIKAFMAEETIYGGLTALRIVTEYKSQIQTCERDARTTKPSGRRVLP